MMRPAYLDGYTARLDGYTAYLDGIYSPFRWIYSPVRVAHIRFPCFPVLLDGEGTGDSAARYLGKHTYTLSIITHAAFLHSS